jgi:hypothetical protein
VLEDVLPADGQDAGQHLDGVLVANVQKLVHSNLGIR